MGAWSFILRFMALDSFPYNGRVLVWVSVQSSVAVRDVDGFDQPSRLRTGEIDRQQAVVEVCTQHIHAVREHEGALELARRNAAVKELPGLVVVLPPADDELALLDRHVELVAGETGDRKRSGDPPAAGSRSILYGG